MRKLPITSKRAAAAVVVAAMIALAAPLQVLAASKPPLPIHIQADNASFDKDTGRSVYTGSVKLVRGGLTLTGKKLVLTNTQQKGQLHAVLTGSPAHIDKQPGPAGKHMVTGHAHQIIFDNASHKVTLQGDAYLRRADGNSVRAEIIIHHLQTNRSVARNGQDDKGRVKVILRPDNNTTQVPQ